MGITKHFKVWNGPENEFKQLLLALIKIGLTYDWKA